VTQAVLQDELNADDQRRWAERAVRAVNRGFPFVEFSNWPQCERWLPQAQTAAAWIERWDFGFEEGGRLLNNAAGYLHKRGRFAEVEPLYQRALAIWEQALGSDHPNVAQSLNNLAVLYKIQGRTAEAEPLYQRALAIWEHALGPDHPDVAASPRRRRQPPQLGRAVPRPRPLRQGRTALAARPGDPPHVAHSLNNLAGLYRDQDRFAEAEPLHQRALAIRERALDPNHPDVATSLNNLRHQPQ